MNISQLKQGLEQAFYNESHRLVFWYDPEQSFTDELASLSLGGVTVLNMATESALGTKLMLEMEDKVGKYLLYFPFAEPDLERDWLLDIKLYSRCFYADRFSSIFNELGLQQQSLREHLAKRDRFLAKSRIAALQRYVQPDFDAADVDMAMISTVVKAESADLTDVILALAEEMAEQMAEHISEEAGQQTGEPAMGLEHNPSSMGTLKKYDLLPALVAALDAEIGYPATADELAGNTVLSLGQFFIRLLTTGFCESAAAVPDWARGQVMSSVSSRATVSALLSRWQDSSRYYKAFDTVSAAVAEALRITEKLGDFDIDQLAGVVTFEVVEQKMITDLVAKIPEATVVELAYYHAMITARVDGYWASKHSDDEVRKRYRRAYTALQAAIDLFTLRLQYDSGFHFESVAAVYQAYESELYRFDMSYRHYFMASQASGLMLLKSLDDQVERSYSYWFIDNLAKGWGDRVEAEQRLDNWQLPQVQNQQNFYRVHVKPLLAKASKPRVVVIISDAFRYEAAVELRDRINLKRYSQATLSSQLGVVPSYTTLGMASLLPHETLEYRDTAADDVFVDGKSSRGTVARAKVLADYGGLAVTAETVKSWSRDEGREALREQKLVYVYHNVVDARGDNAATESGTFAAVEEAIEELTELSRKVLMHFNTSTVLITADHGFLFQQGRLEEADRTSLAEKPSNALKSKKRYVIGHGLSDSADSAEVWAGSTKATAGTSSETDFWVPKGANRFHFVGGSRFVHGGAMPQEIVVPVLTVKQLRGKQAEKRTRRKVSVISTKSTLKMVNNIQRFELRQTEAVSELVTAVTLSVAIYAGESKVSSEETVTFDCATDVVSEHIKHVRLSLSGTDFDRQKDYFLVLKDKDLNTEMERYKVVIDLAFSDDFTGW